MEISSPLGAYNGTYMNTASVRGVEVLQKISALLSDRFLVSNPLSKQWFYKRNILVLDMSVGNIRVAYHVEDRFNGLHFKVFGRDVLSRRILERVLFSLGKWNASRVFKDRLSIRTWKRWPDPAQVVSEVEGEIRTVFTAICALGDQEIVDQIKCINGEVASEIKRKVLHGG